MIRTVVIDDEFSARLTLKNFLASHCSNIEVIGEADGVESGVDLIVSTEPSLVFLDIQMQDGTGFDLLSKLPDRKFALVFTTAFDQYAVKAFKFSALDYLLKPIDPEELKQTVSKVEGSDVLHSIEERIQVAVESNLKKEKQEKLVIQTTMGYEIILLNDLIRVEADGSYCHLFLTDARKVTISRPLKFLNDLLPPEDFVRIHQSHLINLSFVVRLSNDFEVTMTDGSKASVARRKRKEFLEMLNGK